MGTLHKWSFKREMQSEPQITSSSAVAFGVIVARFSMLQGAKQEHLWLIYVNGLLTADTPPAQADDRDYQSCWIAKLVRVSASPSRQTDCKIRFLH